MLREIAHLDAAAQRDRAAVWRRGTDDQLQQRGLAGAVHAHHRPALLAPHLKIQPLINAARAIAFAHAFEAHDVLARTRRWQKIKLNHLPALWRLHALDLVEFFHAALHLRGMGSARLEAFNEFYFFGEHRLLAFKLRLLLLLALRALLFIKFIIA